MFLSDPSRPAARQHVLERFGFADARKGIAEHGFDKFIEFLVANGADLTAKDANGRTPLDVARGAGGVRGGPDAFPKTVTLLESLMKEKGIAVPEAQGRSQ